MHAVAVYAFDICAQFCEGCKKVFLSRPQEAYRIGKTTLFARHSSSSSLLGTRCTKVKKEPQLLLSLCLQLSREVLHDLCNSVISTSTEE